MSNPVPLDLQAKIADWRLRAAAGTLTLPEMKEAITHLRAGRISAYSTGVAAKKKAAVAIPAAADMLNELDDL